MRTVGSVTLVAVAFALAAAAPTYAGGQRLGSWLGRDLTPGARAYFEVRAPQPGTTYRVSVFAFDWVQSASLQAP